MSDKNITIKVNVDVDFSKIEELKNRLHSIGRNFDPRIESINQEIGEFMRAKKPVPTPIKMTKELPADGDECLWFDDDKSGPVSGYIKNGDFYIKGVIANVSHSKACDMGGYWAKVDKDQFEFEG